MANGRTTANDVYDSSGELVSRDTTIPPGAARLVWEQDLTQSNASVIKNNSIFDTLAVKTGFVCSLGTTYNMSSGSYGLLI